MSEPPVSLRRMQDILSRWFRRLPAGESHRLYFLTLVIGLVCGLAAVLFHILLDALQSLLVYNTHGRAPGVNDWLSYALLIVIPAAGGLLAGLLLYYVSPESRGSGIPQVKTAFMIGGGRIPARIIPWKIVITSLSIGSGASLGREGPTVQLCASIASWLGRVFRISRQRIETLIPVGAAAGLAAAFNTPIAAVTFTLEEIIGDAGAKPLGSIVIAAVIASVVERLILGEHALFNVPAYRLNDARELFFYALLGIAAAGLSILFQDGLLRLRKWFNERKDIPRWAVPGAGGLLLGITGVIALAATGSRSIFGIGYDQLGVALKSTLPLKILIILCFGKLIGTVVSYSSGGAGGIFGPVLYIGGMAGGALGILSQSVMTATPIQPGAYALVGMGAVFAGVIRAPVTSIIMIFELTNNYAIILPLMVANMVSYTIARGVRPVPIYDALLLQDGVHLKQSETYLLRSHPVSSVMTSSVVTLPAELTVRDARTLVDIMAEHHHAYPMVGPAGELQGIVSTRDLKLAAIEGQEEQVLLDMFGSASIPTLTPDDTLERVAELVRETRADHIPVVDDSSPPRLVGIVTMHDVGKVILGKSAAGTAIPGAENK